MSQVVNFINETINPPNLEVTPVDVGWNRSLSTPAHYMWWSKSPYGAIVIVILKFTNTGTTLDSYQYNRSLYLDGHHQMWFN